jgi:multidrug efflux pump subunit AcrA (membrane-fusion protein)
VTDGETVSLRQVRLGRRYGEFIEILAGLEDGESVATDPVRARVWMKEQVQ